MDLNVTFFTGPGPCRSGIYRARARLGCSFWARGEHCCKARGSSKGYMVGAHVNMAIPFQNLTGDARVRERTRYSYLWNEWAHHAKALQADGKPFQLRFAHSVMFITWCVRTVRTFSVSLKRLDQLSSNMADWQDQRWLNTPGGSK